MWNLGYMKNWRTWFSKKVLKGRAEDGHADALPPQGEVLAIRDSEIYRQQELEYHPVPGQRGKDVEWAPASQVVISRMFEIAKVTPEDFVIDPGSGDGRMVISAAKLGARALGIEFNPKMVELSRKNAVREGVSDKAAFTQGDLFKTDFSMATVVALFLREDINLALRPKILDMKPGARVVSNIFHMGGWRADEVVKVEDEGYYFRNHTVYLWVVPAKVGGIWRLPQGELILEQNFQMVNGVLKSGSVTNPVSGKMTGDRIDFISDGRQYSGRVTENRMEMETNDESNNGWIAMRMKEDF
jgi:hypothetical protein